ncbi:MAG: DUF2335 domain-containing protein [Thermomicrobiales bacterium]
MTDHTDEPQTDSVGDEEGAAMMPPPPTSDPDDALVATDAEVVEAEYRELLDDPNVRRIVARFLSVSESTIGSTPPPTFLRQYEEIHPGAADIVWNRYELEGTMARDEQLHRHEMERKLVDHGIRQETTALADGIKRANRGQLLGFVLAVLFLAAAVFVMWYGTKHDQPWVAATAGGAIVAQIVGVVILFMRERSAVSEEMAEKRRIQSKESEAIPRPELPDSPTRKDERPALPQPPTDSN